MSLAGRSSDFTPHAAAAAAVLVISALLGALGGAVLGVDAASPRDSIEDGPAAVLSLLAHNAAVALLPLALLALGWDRLRGVAQLTDGLIAVYPIANGAAIGVGFARAGSELWAYLPHLPAEWGAIALGVGAWYGFRLHPPENRRAALIALAGTILGVLTLAALLEVYAAPIR